MNYNRMTVKNGSVYQVKANHSGTPTDMAANTVVWFLPSYASPKFSGSFEQCLEFIAKSGAQYVEI